jgi:hypothetical protein
VCGQALQYDVYLFQYPSNGLGTTAAMLQQVLAAGAVCLFLVQQKPVAGKKPGEHYMCAYASGGHGYWCDPRDVSTLSGCVLSGCVLNMSWQLLISRHHAVLFWDSRTVIVHITQQVIDCDCSTLITSCH